MLNRSALIVRPAAPFMAWAAALDDTGILPDVQGEQTVYLIPEFEDDDDFERLLAGIYPEVFERELDGWCTDESTWPSKRNLAMFKAWFTIECHSMIEDICLEPLEDDEFFDRGDAVRTPQL